jgi:hypothetical protein
MHVALNETGILYASAVCHAGWNEGMGVTAPKAGWWRIPPRKAAVDDGGHAFVIVGYTPEGLRHPELMGNGLGQRRPGGAELRRLERQCHGLLGGPARRRDGAAS